MADLSFLKRLIKEDFDQKDQTLVGKIAFIINPALSQITAILNKGLNVNDLNAQVKSITVIVNANGIPTSSASFISQLKGKCSSIIVGRAQNQTNTTVYPTAAPFVSYSENKGQIIIEHISGLQANNEYILQLIAIV